MHNKRPKVRFNFSTVSEKEQAQYYHHSDVFVMPTKSEGFGLTIAESLACGRPVISTNYGGHLDFFDDKVGYPIDVEKMIPATDYNYIYRGAKWAYPDIEHLKKLMRYTYENREELKKKGKKAIQRMKKYTWQDSAKKILSII